MSHHGHFDYSEKRGFLQRFGLPLGLGVIAIVAVVVVSQTFTSRGHAPQIKPPEMVMIKPQLPPPPPPPPPPPRDEPKQQMMEQTPLNEEDVKPVEQQPEAAPALGTNITGNGPADGFGLGHNSGGTLGGPGGRRANASRFGWYANKVIQAVSEALRQNPKTSIASYSIKVRIWSDDSGRVTRVKLADSTGSASIDSAISNEVLANFRLPEAPPDGMPMPITMRLTARRPN